LKSYRKIKTGYYFLNRFVYTPCLKKTVPVLFFLNKLLRQTLAEFYNFWCATSQRNLT